MRNGFALRYAKIGTARDHPLRSPSFALRCTPGIRTSWCPAQHLNPQWACYAVRYAKKEAARGHPPRSHRFADLACGHPGALHSSHISAVASLRTAAQTWGADILVPCVASTFAMRLPEWRPQGIIRRGRLAAHCGTDLAYGHRGALRSIHIRSGFAIRYPNMAPQTDRLPRSPRCTLRQRPGIRISWCASQHRHPRWVCHTGFKHGARKGSSAAVASLRTAAQTWHTDFLVPCTASKSPMGSPCCTVCQDGAARGHPPRSHRFALRRRPGVRTSWCAAQQPHLRGRLASHCGPDVGCGHPRALHRIHIRNAFAKMVPARYHSPRSPRFALQHRSGVRTSWCPAQHPHPQWVCHILSKHGAPNGSSAAVASLHTAAPTWHTDIRVPCTASTCAMDLPHGMPRWCPRGIIRRGPIASHCDADLAYGHPGALHSSHISAVASLRTAAQTWCADILVLCIASTFAMRLPKWRPQGIIRRGRLASHCGTDLAYGHPGALRSIRIRSGFAICYPNIAPQKDRPPRSPRCALRHRPGVRTPGCPAQHRHPRWVCTTVCENGTRKGSSAAVASLRTAAQTWRTDIRVPCAPSTCTMGLPHGMPSWSPRGIIRRGRLASHCDADLAYGHPGALHSI